jgi:putative hemolysin
VAVSQPDYDDLAGAAIDAFSNCVTFTAVYRGIVVTLTEANSLLTKKLEDSSQTLTEIRALLKKERNDRSYRNPFANSNDSYCWTHGYNIARNNTNENCVYPKTGHKHEANKYNNMGVSQANKE